MKKLSLKDLDVKNKRVLMRVDFNVPMENGKITDDSRIVASLPSIEYILRHGGKLILMSHLGRPKGKDSTLSLAPCAKRLSQLLKQTVPLAPDSVGPVVEKMVAQLEPSQILLLENLRFHEGEEEPEKEPDFVKKLAALGDVYVNDAFGTAHRTHASTSLIAAFFPKKAAMGFLMEQEIKGLSFLLENPQRPYYAIIGGFKISTKIGAIKKLLDLIDALFIGGGMVYTFLKAKGIAIGDSVCEEAQIPMAIELLKNPKIHLAEDLIIADRYANDAHTKTVATLSGIPAGWQGMDIGPKTIAKWSEQLKSAKTIFWNGPLGVTEMPHFSHGTEAIAQFLAQCKARTVVGGGDSVAAIQKMGLKEKFAHLSTGGGASIEFIEHGQLPGIDALSNSLYP